MLINTALKNKVTAIFLVVIVVSFFMHAAGRNGHFQEGDSALVYSGMYNFPSMAMENMAGVLANSHTLPKVSKETATKIVDNEIVNRLLSVSHGYLYDEQGRQVIIRALSSGNMSSLYAIRVAAIGGVLSLNRYIPHFVRSAVSLPLSTTYSFGHGLIYGLVSDADTLFQDFMSSAMLVTLVIFHIGVIFIFFTLLSAGINPISAVLGAFFALFSISLSSYGYHLGSTIWQFTTVTIFIWFVVEFHTKWEDKKYSKGVSWLAGILVFFNYLIILCWLAFMLARLFAYSKQWGSQTLTSKVYRLIKGQYPAIIMFFLCALMFFPPGQTRGGQISSVYELFTFPYFIILNIFSLYNKNGVADVLQFTIALLLILVGSYHCLKGAVKQELLMLSNFMVSFSAVFIVVYIFGIMGLGPSMGPSRQILFIAALPIIFAAIGIDFLVHKSNTFKKILPFVLACFTVAGFFSMSARAHEAGDKTSLITINESVQHVLVHGYHHQLLLKDWGKGRAVRRLNMVEHELFKTGDTYLYVTQDIPSGEKWQFDVWREQGLKIDIIDKQELSTGIQFLAYSPRSYPWDRQSGFSMVTFKVSEVAKE